MNRLAELINLYQANELSPEGLDELKALLSSEEHRRDAVSLMHMSAALNSHYKEMAGVIDLVDFKRVNDAAEGREGPTTDRGFWIKAAAAAAVIIGIGFFGLIKERDVSQSPVMVDLAENVNRKSDFIAVLGDVAADAEYRLTRPIDARLGQDFGKNTVELLSGELSFLFGSGANVEFRAPARFEIIDEWNMRLHEGVAIAHVTKAGHGFKIHTPDGEIEDLGTQFGVSVVKDMASSVYVISGKVALRTNEGKERHIISKDEAIQLLASGIIKKIKDAALMDAISRVYHHKYQVRGVAAGPFGNMRTGRIDSQTRLMHKRPTFADDDRGFLLEESIGVRLDNDLSVEHDGSPVVLVTDEECVPSVIQAGQRINSYLFYCDFVSENEKADNKYIVTTVGFENKIIGLQASVESQVLGDGQLSPTTQTNSAGFEMPFKSDRIYIWPDGYTITVLSKMVTSKKRNIDRLRIITEASGQQTL